MNSRSTLHWGKLHEAHRRLYAHVLGAALLNAKSSALRKLRAFPQGLVNGLNQTLSAHSCLLNCDPKTDSTGPFRSLCARLR